MRDDFIYEAEYLSKVNGEHYFNVDLGFRTWTIIAFTVENPEIPEFQTVEPRHKLIIRSRVIEKVKHKPYKYSCRILKKIKT